MSTVRTKGTDFEESNSNRTLCNRNDHLRSRRAAESGSRDGHKGGVTCNNNNGTSWPTTQFWYCVPGGGDQSSLHTAIGSLHVGADAISRLTVSGGLFYVFNNYTDYVNFCSAAGSGLACSASLQNAWGTTVFTNSPVYSAIVEEMVDGHGNEVLNPNTNANTLSHELGHQLDPIYGALLGGTGGLISGNSTYIAELNNKTWPVFNAMTPQCDPSGHGTTGVFNLQATGTTYICANSGQGPGLSPGFSGNNEAVLQKAWPYYYTSGSASGSDCATGTFCELWAESVAVGNGFQKPSSLHANPDFYFNNNAFVCMKIIAQQMEATGNFPTAAYYPSQCKYFDE